MKIKTNQNKNRTNIPISMGINEKVGIFFSKEKRTKELQQENKVLQQKLQQVLQKFQSQNEHLKQIKTKNNAVENLLSVLNTQNQLIEQQNHKIEEKLTSLSQQKQTLTVKEKQLTKQMLEIQRILFENTNKQKQYYSLLQRYQQQIKNQKTLRIAPDSIFNIVNKLQKDIELLKRNINIHQNKLEGKKKYFSLLQNKQKKQQLKQEIIKKQTISKPSLNIYDKNYGSSTNLEFKKKIQLKQKEKNTLKKQDKKPNLKDLNDLIRKKNALMNSNKNK